MKPIQIPRSMSIGTTGTELCEFKVKKKNNNNNMDKLGKCYSYNMIGRGSSFCSDIFHTQFCFYMFYAVKSSEMNLNLYGENTKTII